MLLVYLIQRCLERKALKQAFRQVTWIWTEIEGLIMSFADAIESRNNVKHLKGDRRVIIIIILPHK